MLELFAAYLAGTDAEPVGNALLDLNRAASAVAWWGADLVLASLSAPVERTERLELWIGGRRLELEFA